METILIQLIRDDGRLYSRQFHDCVLVEQVLRRGKLGAPGDDLLVHDFAVSRFVR